MWRCPALNSHRIVVSVLVATACLIDVAYCGSEFAQSRAFQFRFQSRKIRHLTTLAASSLRCHSRDCDALPISRFGATRVAISDALLPPTKNDRARCLTKRSRACWPRTRTRSTAARNGVPSVSDSLLLLPWAVVCAAGLAVLSVAEASSSRVAAAAVVAEDEGSSRERVNARRIKSIFCPGAFLRQSAGSNQYFKCLAQKLQPTR